MLTLVSDLKRTSGETSSTGGPPSSKTHQGQAQRNQEVQRLGLGSGVSAVYRLCEQGTGPF